MNNWNLFAEPRFYLSQLVLVTAVAGLCLLTIWAGLSRRHWFLRAAGVWVGIAALLPIRAYGPLPMFLFALPAIAVLVLFLRRMVGSPAKASDPSAAAIHARTGWLRFGLRDIFLAVLLWALVVATAMAMWRGQNGFSGPWVVETGACLVTLAVLSTAVALARRKRWLWIVALAGSVAGTTALHALVVDDWIFMACAFDLCPPDQRLGSALAWVEFCGLLVVTLLLARIAFAEPDAAQPPWRKSAARWLLLGQAAIFLFPLAGVYCLMLQRPLPPQQIRGASNNYRQLLVVVERLSALNPAEMTVVDLQRQASSAGVAQQVAEQHAKLLAMVQQPGNVPFDLAEASKPAYTLDQSPHIQNFRGTARMWRAEAQAAAKAGRFDEAAGFALACVQMGNTLSRGGLLIHYLAGVAAEDIGRASLCEIRGDVTPARVHALLAELDRIEKAREPLEAVLARDAVCEDRNFGWPVRFRNAMTRITGRLLGSLEAHLRQLARERDARLRLLRTDLAVRLFRQDCGRLPERLEELAPHYFAAVPFDPFSTQPLVYRRKAAAFVLYSVGPDGVDNGGKFNRPAGAAYHGYDLDLD